MASNDLQLVLDRPNRSTLIIKCKFGGPPTNMGRLTFEAEVQFTNTYRKGPIQRKTASEECDFEVNVRHRHAYYIICRICNPDLDAIATKSVYYHTLQHTFEQNNAAIPFNQLQMNRLLKKAIQFVNDQKEKPVQIDVLFRNNPRQYFEDIRQNKGGIMQVGPKNTNGDPRCPIGYGRIKGIDFSCGKEGSLIRTSPFGDTRLTLPVKKYINPETGNLYFADIFCHKKRHHVTLVVAKPGSEADLYCAENLIKLPMIPQNSQQNPFFFYRRDKKQFYCTFSVWIELYFTENVDLGAEIRNNKKCLQGRFRPRSVGYGKPKRGNCTDCSLNSPVCKKQNCKICTKIKKCAAVTSGTGEEFPCNDILNFTCRDDNLIYMVECNECGMQYVGETKRRLGDRMAEHFKDIVNQNTKSALARHMKNRHDFNNGVANVSIMVLEFIMETSDQEDAIRFQKETEWIARLGTLEPYGINKQP